MTLRFDGESANHPIVAVSYGDAFAEYCANGLLSPLLLHGNSLHVLSTLPSNSVFVRDLAVIFSELKRVLKPEGSFWLNIGDSYQNKALLGIPWRVAFELT